MLLWLSVFFAVTQQYWVLDLIKITEDNWSLGDVSLLTVTENWWTGDTVQNEDVLKGWILAQE